MKVALVHDWLNGMRGGENVLESIADIYPEAEIYTLFCDPETISEKLKSHKIVTSFIQNLPLRRSLYRHYLPLFPRAIEQFNFNGYDLIISTSHCVAKGVKAGPDTLHICYCHSPMRYVWDRFDDYFPKNRINPLRYRAIRYLTDRLRKWDRETAGRVDLYIANSGFVRQRIEKYYDRPARVIYPPVDTEYYSPGRSSTGDYFLLAGALVPYKKADIVIEAFNEIDDRLVVVGDGPELGRLKGMASNNVEFAGWIGRERLREYYRGCRALIFPGVEDFGIVPVETQACGKPVIALGEGGALDTVIGPTTENYRDYDGSKTGLFLTRQSAESVMEAIRIFKEMEFDRDSIVKHAGGFAKTHFTETITDFITGAYDRFQKSGKSGLEDSMIP